MQAAFIVLLANAEKACTNERTALWVQNSYPAKEVVFFLGPCKRTLTVLEQQYFVNSSIYQLVYSSSSSFTFTVTIQSPETFALTAYGRLLWCYSFINSLLTAVTCHLCTWLFLALLYMNIKMAIGSQRIFRNNEIPFLRNSVHCEEVAKLNTEVSVFSSSSGQRIYLAHLAEQPWGPHVLLPNESHGLWRPVCEADNLLPSGAEVKTLSLYNNKIFNHAGLLMIPFALTRAVKQYGVKLNRKNSPLCSIEIHFLQLAMSTRSFLVGEQYVGAGRQVYRVYEVAKEQSLCCFVYQSSVTDTAQVTR